MKPDKRELILKDIKLKIEYRKSAQMAARLDQ